MSPRGNTGRKLRIFEFWVSWNASQVRPWSDVWRSSISWAPSISRVSTTQSGSEWLNVIPPLR